MSARKWSEDEDAEILTIRFKLKDLIAQSSGYPDVVGDRKILRYLRGHDHNLEKVLELYTKYLNWRKEKRVDAIRDNIVNNGMDHPLKFPNGELILSLVPQLVIAPYGVDKLGSPICVDQYNFSPKDVLNKVSIEQYIEFVIYSLESLILEQLSEQRERQIYAKLSQELSFDSGNSLPPLTSSDSESPNLAPATASPPPPPYGVLLNTCVIRDLGAVGFEHLGSKGQEIIKAVITIGSDFYPELMRKCFMINTPWIFNTIWYFIKGMLSPRTLSKVSVMGTSFMDELLNDINEEFIPSMVGGSYDSFMTYEPFPFDTEYLNTKIPNLTLEADKLVEDTIRGDSSNAEQKIVEEEGGGGEVSKPEPDLTESGIGSSEEMTSSGPIFPPTPPNVA
eukprot:gene34273-44275_t